MTKIKKEKKYLIIAIIVIIILIILYKYKPLKQETIVILKEQDMYPDLSQSEQGSVIIDFKATDRDVNIAGIFPTKILLFRSKVVNGLVIYYLYNEQVIEGGVPRLTTPKVNLLDGMLHKIAYTFKKDEKQALYFDGQKVAEGKYLPSSMKITGFAVKGIENEVKTDLNINYNVYDRVLTEEEIKELRN